jgi:hypothetical protein
VFRSSSFDKLKGRKYSDLFCALQMVSGPCGSIFASFTSVFSFSWDVHATYLCNYSNHQITIIAIIIILLAAK